MRFIRLSPLLLLLLLLVAAPPSRAQQCPQGFTLSGGVCVSASSGGGGLGPVVLSGTPSSGQVPTATGPTTATWQAGASLPIAVGIESTETMSFTLSCSADNLYIIPISGSGITATIPSGCAQGTTFIPVNVGSSNVTVNFSANSQTYDENGTTNNAAKILSPCTTAPCTGPSITMDPSGTNWLLKNSQGAAGAAGAAGATGATGSSGGGTTLSTTGSGYFLPFGDVAFQTAGQVFTANDTVLWQFVCCGGNSLTLNTVASFVFAGVASSNIAAAIYADSGLASGSYVSGITATGSGTCILTFTNGATATVGVSTGVVAGALTITAPGANFTAAPTTATPSPGTASGCTGTPVLTTVLGAGTLLAQASTGNSSASQGRFFSAMSTATTLDNGSVYWVAVSDDTSSVTLAEEGTTTASLFTQILNQTSHPREAKCTAGTSWTTGTPTFPAVCGAFTAASSHRAFSVALLP